MKTVTLKEPGRLVASEMDAPAEVPVGHALVRVRRVGICGTDWHAFGGRQPFFSYPRILGHELGVEVERVNDALSDLKPGDRCSVEPYLNCGRCVACRRGRGNCCANLKVMGVHVDGGMREQVVVPTRKLHRSNNLSLEQLALVETLAIGCHAVERAGVEKDEWALVVGAGPIGLSVIPFVKAGGARVMVMDVNEERLKYCQAQGQVDGVIDASGADLVEELSAETNGELPTVVFDATGNPKSMMKDFDLVAPSGRIVFVGLFQGEITFNDPNFHRREVTLLASRNALPGDFRRIIKLVEDGIIDTTAWITHRTSCDEVADVMPEWAAKAEGLVKAMVEF